MKSFAVVWHRTKSRIHNTTSRAHSTTTCDRSPLPYVTWWDDGLRHHTMPYYRRTTSHDGVLQLIAVNHAKRRNTTPAICLSLGPTERAMCYDCTIVAHRDPSCVIVEPILRWRTILWLSKAIIRYQSIFWNVQNMLYDGRRFRT